MGIKSNLSQYIRLYKELRNDCDIKIKEIKESEMYSEEYKNQLVKQEKAKLSAHKDDIKGRMLISIEESKKKLQDKRKSVVKDLAFELRLNNALKTIELAGKSLDKDELKTLVEPFKDDYGTMKSLFHIFRAKDIDTNDIIPTDGIEYQISDLEDKTRSIIEGIAYDNDMTIGIAMSMMSDDIE